MIDVKQAVESAGKYVKRLYSEARGLRVEETEIADDSSFWFITLSFFQESPDDLFGPDRSYKEFKIDAETGDILSMKIKKIA